MISKVEVARRDGGAQAIAALIVAAVTAAMIAIPSWADSQIAGRLAICGVLVLGLAVVIGSRGFAGLASLPILGSALIVAATSNQTEWIQSIVVGCLWYVAVELTWDSIDRRASVQRSTALNLRRINEVSTVIVATLALSLIAYAAATFEPSQTISRQTAIIAGFLVALGFAVRHVVSTSPTVGE